MRKHLEKNAAEAQVTECFSRVRKLASTPKTIKAGFEAYRLWPFNRNLFTEQDIDRARV